MTVSAHPTQAHSDLPVPSGRAAPTEPSAWLAVLRALCVLGISLACALPARAALLGDAGARQLLTRAGFAPSPSEVAAFTGLTQAQAVDRLLAGAAPLAQTPPPTWVDEAIVPPRELQAMSEQAQREYRQRLVRQSLELRAWWLREMAATPSPLTERMTLFWHNHFVSAQPKVRWPQMLYRQNVLFRTHALGSFAELTHAIARDPAMLVYLDAATNRRGQPNENFARELMELFTLGQGNYSETDIREAARAFTGNSLDLATGTYLFRPNAHDRGRKTVLGASGEFHADDVIRILLAQPATAEFIIDKLWREFVSPQPDARRVAAIAADFRRQGYAVPVALRALLVQPEVVSSDPAHALVKSPVELVIGLARQSGGTMAQPGAAALALAAMGQNLFGAPNVRGWPGGEAWINTQTLLARKQFIERTLVNGAPLMSPPPAALSPVVAEPSASMAAVDGPQDQQGGRRAQMERMAAVAVPLRVDAAAWLQAAAGLHPERPLQEAQLAHLAAALSSVPPSSTPAAGTLALDALRAVLLDPAYQLK